MDATVTDPLVGQVLDQRYRLERRLARGGMGTVYLGVDERLDRPVAVKVMHPVLAADQRFAAGFLREARAAARLTSPHAVAIYDSGGAAHAHGAAGGAADARGAAGGAAYLVMEYVEGRTLRDLLDERGRLSPGEALDVLEPVLAALAAAHAAGIVHRDIKPENVLVADDGRVKVADFGLARAVAGAAALTQGLLLGTAAYLAPEQVEHVQRGHAASPGPAGDAYAAGIVLYELLTGAPPYDGDSVLGVAYRHVHEDVPAPSAAVPGIPAAVDALVRWATRRDPGQRPRDAGELYAQAVAVRRSLPPTPTLPPTPSRPAPLTRSATDRHARRAPTQVLDGATTVGVGPVPSGPASAATLDYRSAAAQQSPAPARRHLPLRLPVLVGLGLLALVLGGGWWMGAGPGHYTSTPALLQLAQTQAQDKARAAGLQVAYAPAQFDEHVPAEAVLATSPAPGQRIAKAGVVQIVLSKGKERLELPDVRGLTPDDARRTLGDRAFVVGRVDERHDDEVPPGQVVATEPASGALLRRGQLVDLVASLGPAPVAVPDVDERNPDEARRVLEAAGFRVELRGPRLFGQVTGTTPEAGVVAPRGSLVTVSTW